MRTRVIVKRHPDPARGLASGRHRDWLDQLDSGVRIPHAYPGSASLQILERLDGRPAGPDDLPQLAETLGRLHGTAHTKQLHAARLDQPFTTTTCLTIPDFVTSRRVVLRQAGVDAAGPVAFYKDANIRNFVLTPTGPAVVDFDDLTLAPFGYDLAKLVVSTAMTHGRLPAELIDHVIDAYNHAVAVTGGPTNACTHDDLAVYADIHHALTGRYLHRNGYQHTWPDVRPWPSPG